jgi:hypothetical protein
MCESNESLIHSTEPKSESDRAGSAESESVEGVLIAGFDAALGTTEGIGDD